MPSPGVLIVEGSTDLQFVKHLAAHYDIPDQLFTIKAGNSDSGALEAFSLTVKARSHSAIGLVIDADTNAAKAFGRAIGNLTNLGYKGLPKRPPSDGWIKRQAGLPALGIWVMPNNKDSGKLEDLAGYMIGVQDALWPHALEILRALPDTRFKKADEIKARLHSWLAWQKEPGLTIGAAVWLKYLNPNCQEAKVFANWLQQLFEK